VIGETAQPVIYAPALAQDLIVLSLEENGYAHLFVTIPGRLELTRITAGQWNDITPALSPDGSRLAFASNRGGFYDLYLLDLQTGGIQQLTDTPGYDASPTWSPDLAWIAYESYGEDNLDIALFSLTDAGQSRVLLTDDPSADHSPAWAPSGRQIVFISDRTGNSDVWLADLDRTTSSLFTNLSNTPDASEKHPAWSADGSRLAWSSEAQTLGYSGIYVWQASEPGRPAAWLGDGDWPAWNSNGDQIISLLDGSNQQYLTSYTTGGRLLLAPFPLPGHGRGINWPRVALPDPLPASYEQAAALTATAEWSPAVTMQAGVPAGRWYVVPLNGVQAPYPELHDLVDESFQALRERITEAAGWDSLASLENAFVPLSSALDPGYAEDWLYTGRAFAINSLMANAGWMAATREQIGSETYWRLYIRALKQDGSQGEPINDSPWDLAARYELDPGSYEAGGQFASIPSGYWVDVTSLAAAYGWQRLPALASWRTYYEGTRFTEFVMTGGLSWYAAMQELYPADILVTPTQVLAPTATASRTPVPSNTPGPSRTPRPTLTATVTRTPTSTPTPSPTPPTVIPTFK
jgi:TolB protein